MSLVADAYVREWLDLLLRWLHVIAAIVWIGTSFYFVALDYHLRPPRDRARRASLGDPRRRLLPRARSTVSRRAVLPGILHWFKWEAYTTWLSGFTLLVVLYYVNANTYLIDRAVADLSRGRPSLSASACSRRPGSSYDGLCRLLAEHDSGWR